MYPLNTRRMKYKLVQWNIGIDEIETRGQIHVEQGRAGHEEKPRCVSMSRLVSLVSAVSRRAKCIIIVIICVDT